MASFASSKSLSLTAFPCLLLLLYSVSPLRAADGDDKPSAYEVLNEFEFPSGILPKGAVGYDLDRSTGKFSAYLNGSCSFSIQGSYKLAYKSTITGVISKNKLSNLKGVSVKVLFLWVDVIEVTREGDTLDFSVGIASAGFAVDNFEESPQCGCGFNCVTRTAQARKMGANSLVSSS
ncbi:PREDICTED: uncharacterized protein LOC104606192 [Nelumbo nucifera]|uniref:Uncharacterized protein n=2 Tax=Nelumbo nucifera TaxID=4432 RepID=A0A822YL84_NELNU|nr:PREDICTED: uncharacterized protein LOC104606192 [Nelumbo nucifera]DAD33267.1 TPA_asm: hypothetical protein HUJ06_012118 [Nelumbo nucifera]